MADGANPRFTLPLLFAFLALLPSATSAAPGDEHWDYRFGLPGVDGYVGAVAVNGNETYAGGDFTTIGNVLANDIAKWDGQTWTPLGSGMSASAPGQSFVFRLAFATNGDVYAGGQFTSAGGVSATNVARWNGTSWSPLGSGVSAGPTFSLPAVAALAVSGSNLYVGGGFTNAGGLTLKALAQWNGSSWLGVGGGVEGGTNTAVYAIVLDGTDILVGGFFTHAGGLPANSIAKWDGTNWSALGGGLNGSVGAIVKNGNDLFVAGRFSSAGGVAATNVARWDGTNWFALGNGLSAGAGSASVYALAANASDVFAGGIFSLAGTVSATNVARWDGTNWSSIGDLTTSDASQAATAAAYTLATGPAGQLYAGGFFSRAGTRALQSLAQWDGTNWLSFGPETSSGMSQIIRSLAAGTNALYGGGLFFTAGQAPAGQVAKWNGTNWSAVGGGLVGKISTVGVAAVAVSGNDVYIGGNFTNAGGMTASNIAKWNGSEWTALGNGVNNNVVAVAVDGANVYVGGSFTNASGASASRIAKWNGSAWSGLGAGLDNTVSAIAVGANGIYVGGSFTLAGGAPASHIARWDGANWLALDSGGNGVNGNVSAIAVSGSNVYVGGSFAGAGNVNASMVAKWDGASWTNLGSGIQGSSVSAIAVIGGHVYVSGNFTTAGGVSATSIARWDGSAWTALGSGAAGAVVALAGSGDDLYVGGSFQRAGGKPAYRFGRWNEQTTFLPPTTMRLSNPSRLTGGGFQFHFTVSGGANCIIEATTNFSGWTPLLTNSSSSADFVDTNSFAFPFRSYRMRQIP